MHNNEKLFFSILILLIISIGISLYYGNNTYSVILLTFSFFFLIFGMRSLIPNNIDPNTEIIERLDRIEQKLY